MALKPQTEERSNVWNFRIAQSTSDDLFARMSLGQPASERPPFFRTFAAHCVSLKSRS